MTAYEMRISDWISDVCSSDLVNVGHNLPVHAFLRLASVPRGTARRIRGFGQKTRLVSCCHQLCKACESGSSRTRSQAERSEERREGKECVSACRSRWSPDH